MSGFPPPAYPRFHSLMRLERLSAKIESVGSNPTGTTQYCISPRNNWPGPAMGVHNRFTAATWGRWGYTPRKSSFLI